jgi:hypothetical protein
MKVVGDVDAGTRRRRNQWSGLMHKRKLAGTRAGEASLPELLDQLELTLAGMSAGTSVSKALFDLNRRLGSPGGHMAARSRRAAPAQRRNRIVVESLPLFS